MTTAVMAVAGTAGGAAGSMVRQQVDYGSIDPWITGQDAAVAGGMSAAMTVGFGFAGKGLSALKGKLTFAKWVS